MKTILALLYELGLKIQEILFDIGIFKIRTLPCKVISVGNLTAGGTGKTPVVEFIARQIALRRKVAILTRGYKRKNKAAILDVKPESSPKECGDEAVLLARKTGVPVIAAVNRFKGGKYAIEKYGAQLCVLDDGFQRRHSLYRNMELLLIDASNPFGNGKLLPAGILREKISSIMAADVVMITKADDAVNIEELRETINAQNDYAEIIESVYAPAELYNIFDKDDKLLLTAAAGKKIFALSAIGNPKYFDKVISGLNPSELVRLVYPDHHSYRAKDTAVINEKAAQAELTITTEKDAVKLAALDRSKFSKKIYALKIELKIIKGEKEFLDRINIV